MILEKTFELINQKLSEEKEVHANISKVVIGVGYTGVELNINKSSFLGVSYTLPEVLTDKECSKINFAGTLTEKSVNELLEWSLDPPSIKKIVGIATINAISQYILQINDSYTFIEGDLFDYLKLGKRTTVTFIGLIKPMIRRISKTTKNITIIERNLKPSPFFKQFNLAHDIRELSGDELQTDILICTGTALINGTIEQILETFEGEGGLISLIGPTASILPDVLFNKGFNLLGGMFFEEPAASLKVIQEGGGTRFFKKYGKKYNVISEN
jgi:uncharacterized protein (DUF4213/DUF364 family)